LKTRNLSAY